MAELAPRARLQPALLDRLTDHEPGATQEGRDRRVMSLSQIRAAVLRDLGWLLNTTCHTGPASLGDGPLSDKLEGLREVERSVLNYGVASLTGRTAASLKVTDVERMITRAIERYEPRILARTLRVRVVTEQGANRPNTLVLEIAGHLWAQPVPEALYIRTQLDLETGHFSVEERAQ